MIIFCFYSIFVGMATVDSLCYSKSCVLLSKKKITPFRGLFCCGRMRKMKKNIKTNKYAKRGFWIGLVFSVISAILIFSTESPASIYGKFDYELTTVIVAFLILWIGLITFVFSLGGKILQEIIKIIRNKQAK